MHARTNARTLNLPDPHPPPIPHTHQRKTMSSYSSSLVSSAVEWFWEWYGHHWSLAHDKMASLQDDSDIPSLKHGLGGRTLRVVTKVVSTCWSAVHKILSVLLLAEVKGCGKENALHARTTGHKINEAKRDGSSKNEDVWLDWKVSLKSERRQTILTSEIWNKNDC